MLIVTMAVFAYNPKVYIRLSSNEIYSGEDLAITLIAEASEKSNIQFPKLSNINGFDFKNSSKVIKRKLVNDSTAEIYTQAKQTFVIRPNKSFDIEKFKILIDNKPFITKSHHIKVLSKKNNSKSPKATNKQENFKVVMNINKKNMVKGDYAIASIKIFQPLNIDIADAQFNKPTFKGFNILPFKPKAAKQQNGYAISELKYILIPKSSGNFTIEPARIEFTQGSSQNQSATFAFFGAENQTKKISSNSLNIKVTEPPKNIDIIGNYIVKSKFKHDKFYKSTPISYTVIVEGEGNLKGVDLPKIDIDGLTVYDKEPVVKQSIKDGKLYSILRKEYTFVSTKNFTIPKISINFYNPKSKQIVTKTLPEIPLQLKLKKNILELLKSKDKVKTNTNSEQLIDTNQQSKENINNILFDQNYYKSKYLNYNAFYKYILTLIMGIIIGVLFTIYIPIFLNLFKRKEFKSSLYNSYEEALNILYPHTEQDKEIERMVKRLYEVINGNKEIKIDHKRLDKAIKSVLKDV